MPSRIIWNWPALSSMRVLSGGGVGEVVASGFQALAPQAQAVAAPVQDLEAVGGAVAEDEQVAGQRVGLQPGADQGKQAVEAQTHIDGFGAKPELDGRGQAQHDGSPRAATRERTKARSQPGGKRRTAPVGRTSSTAGAAGLEPHGQQTWSAITAGSAWWRA